MENKIAIRIYKYLSNSEVLDLLSRYDEPHRFYHTREHISEIFKYFDKYLKDYNYKFTEREADIISICTYFHDAVYNPKKHNNEQKSVELLNEYTSIPSDIMNECSRIIMDTASIEPPKERLSSIFWYADRSILFEDFNKLIDYENKIFKEFQFVPYDVYREKRSEFLQKCIDVLTDLSEEEKNNLENLIDYIKSRKPSVGVYAGSFNPMTIGHLNVIEKSNKIFDKVIIAFGNNLDKQNRDIFVPECVQFYQIEGYDTLITTFIDKIENQGVDVTLIRGIRNGNDLSYESNQLSFINDIRPNTNVIYVPCDKQYEHISSSAIRNLMKFDQFLAEKYMAK